MKSPEFISAGNYHGEPLGEEELMAKRLETIEKLKKGNIPEKKNTEDLRNLGKEIAEEMKGEAFPSLFKAFSSDVDLMRKMVAEYNNIQDLRMRELKGEEILDESAKIMMEIQNQIEASDDPYEKGDFDNLRLELEQIIKNVSGMPDLKRANA